ncbi:hypothetical protein EAM_0396 [Erwinia amylovora ATCC 49946]|nr:hypothetical protein EAM_0396 [Erwinia amylovora ATCC 49946]
MKLLSVIPSGNFISLPRKYVNTVVSSQKGEENDALAICETASRPASISSWRRIGNSA